MQALGGTGGLKIGADFLRQLAPAARVWISEPSWENHRALFEGAGFKVDAYPYFDPATRGLRFEPMLAALDAMPAGDIVVLHSCCHNPTGVDLSPEQWRRILAVVQARGLVPFLDLAYQGFADGIDADAYAARLFAGAMSPVFLSSSFSKSLSLYGERVGAFSLVAGSADEAARALSQVKRIVRWRTQRQFASILAEILGDKVRHLPDFVHKTPVAFHTVSVEVNVIAGCAARH